MKSLNIQLAAIALALMAGSAGAQQKMDDMMKQMPMPMKPAASTQATHTAKGTVKKMDAKAGVVTLAHEPVSSLNWPAMTMGFKVLDKTLVGKLGEGRKVEVQFVKQGEDYVVTSVK